MKKLLSLFTSIGLCSVSTLTVIACESNKVEEEKGFDFEAFFDDLNIDNIVLNYDFGEKLTEYDWNWEGIKSSNKKLNEISRDILVQYVPKTEYDEKEGEISISFNYLNDKDNPLSFKRKFKTYLFSIDKDYGKKAEKLINDKRNILVDQNGINETKQVYELLKINKDDFNKEMNQYINLNNEKDVDLFALIDLNLDIENLILKNSFKINMFKNDDFNLGGIATFSNILFLRKFDDNAVKEIEKNNIIKKSESDFDIKTQILNRLQKYIWIDSTQSFYDNGLITFKIDTDSVVVKLTDIFVDNSVELKFVFDN